MNKKRRVKHFEFEKELLIFILEGESEGLYKALVLDKQTDCE